MDLVSVVKIAGGFAVLDHNGEPLIGYRNKKHAESFALGHACSIYGEAEYYNDRLTRARAYLKLRALRVFLPKAQFALF